MDPQKITELANLLRKNGDKILNSEFTLTLSGSLLRALNDSFTLIADSIETGSTEAFQVLKPINSKSPVFRDLQLVYDFVQKTTLLCIVHYPTEDYFENDIDISKFRALKRLELQRINVRQIIGIQKLRSQLQQLICVKSLQSVTDIITHCGGDNSNGFVWNELKTADFSYNNLQTVDTSLEFAQYLQQLNLRHNKLRSVEAIKWLPHLKTLDLSFNCLQCIPQFHMDAYKRLQSLNMSNNFVEDLMGTTKLDALTDLDLSDNCLLDHTCLLPLSALITLKYLNLYGNPLHYHPKHRLATAQFLHKNTATVKFILDFEPLSKSEKAITGTQQLRHVGSLNRYTTKSSAINSGRLSSGSGTPASSVGSLISFKFQESSTETATTSSNSAKKRVSKVRTVEIEDANDTTSSTSEIEAPVVSAGSSNSAMQSSMSKSVSVEPNVEHLEAKKNIETLRKKYGAEWLQSAKAEMKHILLGIDHTSSTEDISQERNTSRQIFNEFLGEFCAATNDVSANQAEVVSLNSSTPTNKTFNYSENMEKQRISPINNERNNQNLPSASMMSSTAVENDSGQTSFESAIGTGSEGIANDEQVSNDETRLENVYSSTTNEEPEVSEPEDDEETYIVYTENRNDGIFLTISSNFLREKDTLTQLTKTKWSLKILESCDRIKSNTLRINFDTIKKDKRERVYTVEDGLCQELEKKLRDILSRRDLTEMNQTIYRCVNCSCQFSRENTYKTVNQGVRCPDCKSTFVAEIHESPKSLEKSKSNSDMKLSPAAIVEVHSHVSAPLLRQFTDTNVEQADETNSIGSANSLNESSSCSKVTNSQSSFDSNQSMAGSSAADRDNDFKSNCESDVDILSNPSQSSIEVLDQMHISSRKTSEERRISQIPNLETIDDQSYTQSYIERAFSSSSTNQTSQSARPEVTVDVTKQSPTKVNAKTATTTASPLIGFNLTESSSSGSVTDSVCTAYEQKDKDTGYASQSSTEKLIAEESNKLGSSIGRKEDSGISSMFGALFQSTNILMSSSKKLIDAETTSGTAIAAAKCKPYKFNYIDFNDIDHRLKLHFYQTKFEESVEHFKWIVRGRIYNENTQTLCDGIVVMSTCKCYVMEVYAAEHDDVTKWLRQLISVTVDRLTSVELLPWKIGLAFCLRDWGGFLLLLQDILRTDSLLLYFANNSLPTQCELTYQPSQELSQRLTVAVLNEKLKMCSLLNSCEVTCENAKRSLSICGLLTTDSRLYLTSEKLSWLSLQPPAAGETDIEICLTQFMSNLVEVERPSDTENGFVLNFLDETQDKCELWKCTFETKENAESCLNAIGQSWAELFGVPLLNA